jgi:hypothetical protein
MPNGWKKEGGTHETIMRQSEPPGGTAPKPSSHGPLFWLVLLILLAVVIWAVKHWLF